MPQESELALESAETMPLRTLYDRLSDSDKTWIESGLFNHGGATPLDRVLDGITKPQDGRTVMAMFRDFAKTTENEDELGPEQLEQRLNAKAAEILGFIARRITPGEEPVLPHIRRVES